MIGKSQNKNKLERDPIVTWQEERIAVEKIQNIGKLSKNNRYSEEKEMSVVVDESTYKILQKFPPKLIGIYTGKEHILLIL